MDSNRRGFFKRLLGLGAAVVAAPLLQSEKTKAEAMAWDKAANPMISAMPEWSSDGRSVRMVYTTSGTTTNASVTCYLIGSSFEVKNG